jgi:hypothetical protein
MAELIPDIGSIADRLTGIFGKAYLLAGVFPIFVLIALVGLAGYDTVAPVRALVEAYQGRSEGRQWLELAALLLPCAVIGFLYWSINGWLRLVLQADAVIPSGLRRWLVKVHSKQQGDAIADLRVEETKLFHLRQALGPNPLDPASWVSRLRAARQTGSTHNPANGQPSDELRQAYDALAMRSARQEHISYDDLAAVFQRLEHEFRTRRGVIHQHRTEMDRLQVGFLADIAQGVLDRLESKHTVDVGQFQSRFPIDPRFVGPTRMSNVAQLCRDRALHTYDFDPELYALPLERQAAADEKYSTVLNDAKVKLDVTVGLTVIFAVSAIGGGILEGARGSSLPHFLLFAVALPVLSYALYQTTIMNLRGFNDSLWTAVQLYRLDALKAMHIEQPTDSVAERKLWQALADQSGPAPTTITYSKPAP